MSTSDTLTVQHAQAQLRHEGHHAPKVRELAVKTIFARRSSRFFARLVCRFILAHPPQVRFSTKLRHWLHLGGRSHHH